jgi:hypothetical protein
VTGIDFAKPGAEATVHMGLVRLDGVDHLWHSTEFGPDNRATSARTVCGREWDRKILRRVLLRRYVRVPPEDYNPCIECRDLPPFFAD